jgi:hypothetical protein
MGLTDTVKTVEETIALVLPTAPEIPTGIYTIGEVLGQCKMDVDESYDRRRITVGGLGFDSLDEKLRVVGDRLVVMLDGQPHNVFKVTE